MLYVILTRQIRWVLEKQQVSIGTWEGFDGAEACNTGAGDALAARRAVESVESAGDSVIIVAGECADYRQVRGAAKITARICSIEVAVLFFP